MNYTLYRFALLRCHYLKRFNYQFNIIIKVVLLYMIQIQLLFLQQCLSKLYYFISSIGAVIVYLHIKSVKNFQLHKAPHYHFSINSKLFIYHCLYHLHILPCPHLACKVFQNKQPSISAHLSTPLRMLRQFFYGSYKSFQITSFGEHTAKLRSLSLSKGRPSFQDLLHKN